MGAKSKTETQIPAYIEQGGKDALAQAQRLQQMGYVPYMGPEVAMYDPTAAMSANQGLEAFGMAPMNTDPMAGAATTTMGGMTGYTSAPMLEQAQMALKAKYPGLYDYLTSMTIDPVTGAMPGYAQPGAANAAPPPTRIETMQSAAASGDMNALYRAFTGRGAYDDGGAGQIGMGGASYVSGPMTSSISPAARGQGYSTSLAGTMSGMPGTIGAVGGLLDRRG